MESTTSPDVAIFASFITSPFPKIISLVRSGQVDSSQTVPDPFFFITRLLNDDHCITPD